MENLEITTLKKRNKILLTVCLLLIIALLSILFYSYKQTSFALANQEKALQAEIELKECEVETRKQREYAAQANLEAEIQKRMTEEAYLKMLEAEKKKK